ncbi:MAG: carboxypeptidase regulatory-like domain-containing protein, partial [Polyangiaceae bacterium]|nr:carboxypeptidase regulatory-like domain-containing protein [Polyangiaceae bacterium]
MGALLRVVVLSSLLVGPPALGAQEVTCPPPDAAAGMGAVIGTVVDVVSRAAVASAHVELRRPRFEAPLRAQSDGGGRFVFCSVPAGEFVVSAREGERRGAVGPVVLEPGATLEVVVEVRSTIEASGTLAGEIVDADTEKPLEGASVFLPELGQSSASNQLGRFVFPSLPPG